MLLLPHRFAECEHDVKQAREEAMTRLLTEESAGRLAYIPIPYDDKERCWVADHGVYLGTIENKTPESVIGEWHSEYEAGGDGWGPFRLARQAAVSLQSPERRALPLPERGDA
jgi:hypothetical protein